MTKITMPLSAFLKDGDDQNYTAVKNALKGLRNKTIEYEDVEKGTWKLIGLIELPKYNKRGYVEFQIHPEIYEAILSFSKGFKKYELKTAMSFDSVYSMRFYEIVSGQKTPLTYTIDNLRVMLHLEGKYKQTRDFLKRTVLKAKEELDAKSPYSFDYTLKKVGAKIHSITLIPRYQPKNRDKDLEEKELQKRTSIRWDLTEPELHYLKNQFGFDDKGIKNNMKLFIACKNTNMSLVDEFAEIFPKAIVAGSPQGYLIAVLKRKLKE